MFLVLILLIEKNIIFMLQNLFTKKHNNDKQQWNIFKLETRGPVTQAFI